MSQETRLVAPSRTGSRSPGGGTGAPGSVCRLGILRPGEAFPRSSAHRIDQSGRAQFSLAMWRGLRRVNSPLPRQRSNTALDRVSATFDSDTAMPGARTDHVFAGAKASVAFLTVQAAQHSGRRRGYVNTVL